MQATVGWDEIAPQLYGCAATWITGRGENSQHYFPASKINHNDLTVFLRGLRAPAAAPIFRYAGFVIPHWPINRGIP
ncbi:MAG: hypothetical protein ACREUF_10480 [Solimonas sp.]